MLVARKFVLKKFVNKKLKSSNKTMEKIRNTLCFSNRKSIESIETPNPTYDSELISISSDFDWFRF